MAGFSVPEGVPGRSGWYGKRNPAGAARGRPVPGYQTARYPAGTSAGRRDVIIVRTSRYSGVDAYSLAFSR